MDVMADYDKAGDDRRLSYEENLARLQTELRRQLEADMAAADEAARLARQAATSSAPKRAFLYTLVRRRLSLKLSQAEVARRAGVSQGAVSRMEAGLSNPTLETVLKITEALEAALSVQSDRIVKSK